MEPFLESNVIHLFIHSSNRDWRECAKCCFICWGYSSKQNRMVCDEAYIGIPKHTVKNHINIVLSKDKYCHENIAE